MKLSRMAKIVRTAAETQEWLVNCVSNVEENACNSELVSFDSSRGLCLRNHNTWTHVLAGCKNCGILHWKIVTTPKGLLFLSCGCLLFELRARATVSLLWEIVAKTSSLDFTVCQNDATWRLLFNWEVVQCARLLSFWPACALLDLLWQNEDTWREGWSEHWNFDPCHLGRILTAAKISQKSELIPTTPHFERSSSTLALRMDFCLYHRSIHS